jgi:uncharacterized protein YrrD
MRKGSDVLGNPVVAFDTGDRLTTIKDLIFDQKENQLLGFVVDEGGWFSEAEVLPLKEIQAIGPDAIVIQSKEAVVRATRIPQIKGVLERNNVMKGTKLMTTDGQDLGTLVDLFFDEESGQLEGYEVSGGLFADAYSGRTFVPAPKTLKIGEDVAFVPPETATLMQEQVGGIKGAVHTAARKAKDSTETVGEKAKRAASAAGERIKEASGEIAASSSVDQALGRRVRRPVYAEGGYMIAADGQIVTEQVVERARVYDKEVELLEAVNLSPEEAASAKARTTVGSARESTQRGADQAKATAADVLERMRAKASEFRHRGARRLEEERVKGAIGRPVNRVILDPQDKIILNVGEIITFKAISEARQADVLDILLNSVHKADPGITSQELRAPEPGRASLEEAKKES